MHKTSSRLSDGREIIYYDRDLDHRDPPADTRDLPARRAVSRMRIDPITGDPVVVADHRQRRTVQSEATGCPLCPTRDVSRPTEVPATDYDVVVFENRSPALTQARYPASGDPAVTEGLMRSSTASGRCEVICFSSDHDTTFAELKPDLARLVLDVWIDRSVELAALPGVAQVFCFENRGPEMGVTQSHPHGQIYAYPFVTPRTAHMLERTAEHRLAHHRNLFDDVLDAELADGRRIVSVNPEWVAFVPFAARWPYEVHIYPRRRRTDLAGLDEDQRDAFMGVYLDVLQRFDRLFDTPAPYVSAWHQAPGGEPLSTEFAVHLELFTNRRNSERLKVLGGTEVGMDTFSNDVSPEQAAERLRALA